MVIIIICLIVALLLYFLVLKPYTIQYDNLCLFTGTPGSGKSFISSKIAKSIYYKNVSKVKFYNFFHRRKKKPIPRFYSNIGFRLNKKEFAYRLTWQHIFLRRKIVEGSVIFIDEVSLFLPQYDIDNVNRDILVEFFSLFRHYTKGSTIIMNTQNLKKVNSNIRYCVSSVFHLSNFKKWIPVLPIVYSCNIRNLSVVEDTVNVVEKNVEDSMSRLIGFFPLTKSIDTYTYSERYRSVPQLEDVKFKGLKTGKIFKTPGNKQIALTKDVEEKTE